MNKPATSKSGENDDSPKTVATWILISCGAALLALSLVTALVIFLLPFGVPPLRLSGSPERSLWLLLMLGLAFGLVLSALGWRDRPSRILFKVGGSVFLVLGLASALAIFGVQTNQLLATKSTTSLWWLFVTCTVAGGIGVYLTAIADEEERKAEEGKSKAEEEKRKAEQAERGGGLRLVFKVRR